MGDQRNGGIAWTDETWNPVRGCSLVSAGCAGCYALVMAARFSGPGQPYEGLAVVTDKGPRWTGKVRLVEKHLADPLRWRRPRRVFVNSMSDLFHESLQEKEIGAVFAAMAIARRHTFQVLTKRAWRMRELLGAAGRVTSHAESIASFTLLGANGVFKQAAKELGDTWRVTWPLPNVHLGVSVEDQRNAEERIPELLQVPAAVRFLSVEPMLGPVDLRRWAHPFNKEPHCPWCEDCVGETPDWKERTEKNHSPLIHWVICGGESGAGARPFDLRWAINLAAQCKAAGIPFFLKQLGANPYLDGVRLKLNDRSGADPAEWPKEAKALGQAFPTVLP